MGWLRELREVVPDYTIGLGIVIWQVTRRDRERPKPPPPSTPPSPSPPLP